MFYQQEDSTLYEISDNAFGFIYKCWIPKIGFGVNSITEKLQETEIFKRSEIPEEQYWERPKLPDDWKVKREAEKEMQSFDKFYFDPYLEEIRQRHWRNRLCGVWFWNYNPYKGESECLYMSGLQYLYCTFWQFQGKHMSFRINDMETCYLLRYCDTDPDSLGLNFLTKRKLGKTALSGCWLYERVARPPRNRHGGIQSKDDDSAEEMFKKSLVNPWQKLPDFFRPIYDTMKSDDPNELRFFHTARRGSTTSTEREEEDALENWIDYGPSGEGYYDGPELLGGYICDEGGKVEKKISIRERQNTVRYCAEIDGEMKGKQFYTTTVEVEPGGADDHEFQELTYDSNPLKRDDNNRTITGLYTFFLPAHKGFYFDIYGHADEAKAKTFLINTRKKLEEEGKTRQLASAKRKNPMTLAEAFSVDGENSLYDPALLQEQLDVLSWGEKQTEFGDLLWVDGHEISIEIEDRDGTKKTVPNKVYWKENPNGRYEKIKGWWPKDENSVVMNNGVFAPNNKHTYRSGCDPFKYDKTKDKRRSNCAAFIYQMPDSIFPHEFDDYLCIRYAWRASSTKLSNMDILKMVWWCGCQVLFERNINHWKKDFGDWKCSGFLMWLPGEVEPGMVTTPATTQMICNYTESYINKDSKKVLFKNLIRKETGWLGFKVEDTEKFDEPMGCGLTFVAVKGKKYQLPKAETRGVESVLPYRRAV